MLRYSKKPLQVSAPNRPSKPTLKGEIQDQQIPIIPHRITGIPHRTLPHKGQQSCQIVTAHHKGKWVGTPPSTTSSTTCQMLQGGCKTLWFQWTSAAPELSITAKEEEGTLEEEGVNIGTTSPITTSKATSPQLVTFQMHASNVDK